MIPKFSFFAEATRSNACEDMDVHSEKQALGFSIKSNGALEETRYGVMVVIY